MINDNILRNNNYLKKTCSLYTEGRAVRRKTLDSWAQPINIAGEWEVFDLKCFPFLACSSPKSLVFCKVGRGQRKDSENLVQLYLGDLCLSIICRLAEQNSMVCGFCFCSAIVFVGMCPRLNFGESVFCIVALRNVKPCKPSPSKCSWHTMDSIAICFFFSICTSFVSIRLMSMHVPILSFSSSPVSYQQDNIEYPLTWSYLVEPLWKLLISRNAKHWSIPYFLGDSLTSKILGFPPHFPA